MARSLLDEIGETDSQWVLLYRRLRDRREVLAADILSGGCTELSYARLCGAYSELEDIINRMEAATRGENRPIRPPEPLRAADE